MTRKHHWETEGTASKKETGSGSFAFSCFGSAEFSGVDPASLHLIYADQASSD